MQTVIIHKPDTAPSEIFMVYSRNQATLFGACFGVTCSQEWFEVKIANVN